MTWNPADPAPYESAWSIFVKLLALNFCKPIDIVRSIAWNSDYRIKKLDFWQSSWIDFERFGVLLRVDPDRLRMGFLDQLGFPQFSSYRSAGIRFCPECLKLGYHCIFFDLALVSKCPIHQVSLTKGCNVCCSTVASNGLLHNKLSNKVPEDLINDITWKEEPYTSRCGHIYFNPETVMESFHTDFTIRKEMKEACEELLQWWEKIFSGSNSLPALVANLAQESFLKESVRTIALSLDIASSLAGNCPWPTSISPLPANWLKCQKTETLDKLKKINLNSYLGHIYRAVRRHIFNRYIRPSHLDCWHEMSNYELWMSRSLSSHTVCTTVMAYMAWRMSIEGFSNIEVFGIKGCAKFDILSFETFGSTANETACFWYAQFFEILGRLEELVEKRGHFYVERSYRSLMFCAHPTFIPKEDGSKEGTWWISFANKNHVIRGSKERCISRRQNSKSMLGEIEVEHMSSWNWAGNYSTFNRPHLLFRVMDEESLRNSYTYLCL